MREYDVELKMRQLVFQRTRAYLAGKGNMKDLAAKSGVRANTLRRLAYGETKYPRFHTVVGVCQALGVRLEVVSDADVQVVPKMGNGK